MDIEKIKDSFKGENLGLMKEDIKNTKAIQLLYDNAVFTDKEDKEEPQA